MLGHDLHAEAGGGGSDRGLFARNRSQAAAIIRTARPVHAIVARASALADPAVLHYAA